MASTGINRLLIANRGEIAVRIARTAHRLGIDTVGIYSEPDANALHVDTVDLAIALGGTAPVESYLRADAVLAAALDTGCDAIHPGYGFLAENAAFAQKVIDAGLIWVGPTPSQIALLGDKVAAKKAAVQAGVPTTDVIDVAPGAIPAGVAMPALVKAAAGGGGRGMRIVRSTDELADAVEAASREALSAFGDGTVFIEPYIERGRHVEVQIIGDRHGNVVHLGERECSIQRRNQKVIEESPSAGISAATRAALCEGALALARHVGYENAGTVEFLVGEGDDGDDVVINFLEVNTRLQVEHPVTEAVTGLDLVELQLRVAAGEPLPVTQDDIVTRGHAIEVRLVAEDPAAGWLPSTGTITSFRIGGPPEGVAGPAWPERPPEGVAGPAWPERPPEGVAGPAWPERPPEGVRVDTGFRTGAVVSSDYDSLLAKVIVHRPTRKEAAAALARVLRTSQVAGIATNLVSLVAILGEPDYLAARTPTAYLDEHPEVLAATGPTGDDLLALLLGAVFATEHDLRKRDGVTGFAPSGWRNLRTQGQREVWQLGSGESVSEHRVEHVLCGASHAKVLIGPWPVPGDDGVLGDDTRRTVMVRLLQRSDDRQVIEIDGRRTAVAIERDHGLLLTRSPAGSLSWRQAPRFVDHEATEATSGGPICPLPGTVIAVHVAPGQRVTEGELLMVVEAMKMEHKITAHADAVVAEVRFAAGDRVDQGDLLVTFEEAT